MNFHEPYEATTWSGFITTLRMRLGVKGRVLESQLGARAGFYGDVVSGVCTPTSEQQIALAMLGVGVNVSFKGLVVPAPPFVCADGAKPFEKGETMDVDIPVARRRGRPPKVRPEAPPAQPQKKSTPSRVGLDRSDRVRDLLVVSRELNEALSEVNRLQGELTDAAQKADRLAREYVAAMDRVKARQAEDRGRGRR